MPPSPPRRRSPNPLRLDPTRLVSVRRRWFAEIDRRVRRATPHVQRLAAGDLWDLQQRVQQVLDVFLIGERPWWWSKYLAEAYTKAVGRTYDEVMKAPLRDPAAHAAGREEFLRRMTARPTPASPFALNAARQTPQARGVSGQYIPTAVAKAADDVQQHMRGCTRKTAEGVALAVVTGRAEGQTPQQIAVAVNRVLHTTTTDAQRIARTVLVRVHAEAQLDSMQALDVKGVTAQVEWLTSGDACPRCSELGGQTYSIDEARGLIPQHPNCACSWGVARSELPSRTPPTATTPAAVDPTTAQALPVEVVGPAPSPQFQAEVQAAVDSIPAHVRQQLAESGARVQVGRTLADIDPQMAAQPARGHGGGKVGDLDGVYQNHTQTVMVGERTVAGRRSDRIEGVVRHELGHALDDVWGERVPGGSFCSTPEFMKAFEADAAAASAGKDAAKLDYFLANGGGPLASRQEVMAEVFAALHGGGSVRDREMILQNFPSVAAHIHAEIDRTRPTR